MRVQDIPCGQLYAGMDGMQRVRAEALLKGTHGMGWLCQVLQESPDLAVDWAVTRQLSASCVTPAGLVASRSQDDSRISPLS